ncbi:hypothetical protein DFA_09087 [Cavenderia fasciculata]|uniref:PQ loop repeat protein n=1 Tax=Cavenderia fasciculata TaxID=261658 RepID=F4Q6N3_CACFS|nr:uncharacterized protein DFA_09087 [Cavenderia fasciculata]EGG16543.1 hypothetical protein DFA_09087 [Cavenderia fasciculata]|eukprot:XP_004354943.1 hypothetical protein DFA_09087 [Cavenderia fasciculata]
MFENSETFGFCINGTEPQSATAFDDILIHMDGLSIALGVGLIIGGVGSTLPQHIKLLKTRRAVGLSYLWLFLGNINQFSAVCNAFMIKYPQIQACYQTSFLDCAPSMLALIQLFSLWVFTIPIYIMYILFTPNDLKDIEESNVANVQAAKREYKIGIIFFGLLIAFLVVIPIVVAVLINKYGPCDHASYIFGYGMGILSTVITFIQWSPQIYKTFVSKSVGSLSITMLLIQGPGTVLTIYFLVFVSKESVSTWLSYVSAAFQIFLLLILLFYYKYQQKRQLIIKQEMLDGSVDDYSISSSSSFSNYISAKEDSQPLLLKNEKNI